MRPAKHTKWRVRAIMTMLVASVSLSIPGLALADPNTDNFRPMDEYERLTMAQIEVELARVSAAKEEADIRVLQVAEELAQAQDELLRAEQQSADAQKAAEDARAEHEQARLRLASVSQTAYRTGTGSLEKFAPYLQADGLAEVQRRSAILEKFSHETDFQLQQVTALDQVARALEEQAKQSEVKVRDAKEAVEARAAEVQTAADAADQQVTEVQERRTALIAQLAERRQVLIAEEEARQKRLEEERQKRLEAAERARVER
ncbi:MAG: hypothetical protein Q4P71_08540 [Actinomycetaceae bacterium]|nr:hypothetical protein [Actinomycetaceae bacterium]